ncbi:MAG: PAS domain S-box protein [Rubrivivax sp.]|nr:PAS domain S-box protein [Rubrivivax sp.]
MDALTSLLGRSGYLPHGYCFTWSPGLLWSMVGADALIAAAYFSIPLTMVSFVRQRKDVSHRGIVWLFSAFIFACGVTHLMGIWTIWQPDYALQTLTKVITAVVSLLTAVMLWRLIPRALAIPSVAQLGQVIRDLEAEVARRRTVEEHLAESQQGLAVTLASIGAGYIATDRAGRVTRMNAVAEQVLGCTQAQALGRSYWDVFPRENRPAELLLGNPVDLMIEMGVTIDQPREVVALSLDGRRTSLELKAALTHADDGSVRGMAVVFRDMTPELQAAAAASRLAAIVESSNDAIISKTMDGRITSWNGAAQTLFGYSAEEAIGQPAAMLMPKDQVHEEARILAELAAGHKLAAFDTQRVAQDGRLIDVSVSVSPLRNAQGVTVGASTIVTDITQRRLAQDARQAAQRLEAENRRIQEANRMKSQFLANMSHELRTPLNAIIGFAELLHEGAVPVESPRHRQFLGHIATSGHHLLQLINDVLDLSKVESGKFEFFPEPVQLDSLVQEVLDIQHTAIHRKRLQLTTDIDATLTGLHLDPARLKQALYNYLSNAIKFTPAGGQIVVRARAEGTARFRLEVQDSGIGIAPADIPRLFSEFQQLDAGYNKQHQGTGLGLALTRRLVQAQGGEVGVSSVLGAGSTFHLVLDCVVRVTVPGPELVVGEALPQRLLVIEDNPARQSHMVRGLSAAGFDIDTAGSAAQALRMAAGRSYTGLTLGLVLTDQAGLVLLDCLRQGGPSSSAPVLGLSMPDSSGGAACFPVSDVLSKPIRTDEVVQALARFKRADGAALRVLVVDDEPMALDLMSATLAGLGSEALCVADGRQALRDLDQHRPDLIILDLMMPGFDGFQTLDALKQMPAWRDTPVFIWTSMILTEDELLALSRSATAILSKGGGALDQLFHSLARWRQSVILGN